ncbi:hypothetical protein M9458_051572, partial [Cirrhinus mrigala]
GKPLGHGKIRHSSPYITLQIGHQHLPELRWDPCDVIRWSEQCYDQCPSNLPRPHPVPVHLASTQVENPEPEIPPEIPAEYVAFQDVFSKQAATHLPPHRPWDCAIELLPGAQLPKGRIYPLSIPECQALEDFFFVGKKDGGLCPCIDYHQLNSQIIQQPYPLPLVPSALEELHGAKIFTKLDLRSAMNGRQPLLHPQGTKRTGSSVFQMFMNEVFREFLHRFVVVYIDDIFIYSRNQAEHRQHVQQVLQKLCEHSLYLKLEKCKLHQPSVQFLGYNISAEGVQMDQDPERPFTVKVNASTVGVGVVLCQAVCESSLLHPCAAFSRKLSPVEQNYDVGNRELLAIKLALEEWRHWLVGATHPFTITDHKNLQYLREAKRTNYKITYRPGSKNVTADALSRQFSVDSPSKPEPIIPSDVIVSPIIWDMDQEIQQATLQEPAPPAYPEGKIYVPRSQRHPLLGAAHQSLGSGNPGSRRTLSLLQTHYWWPSMHHDTIRYVQSCSVCAMSNSPRQLPTGKLTNGQTEIKIQELGRYLRSYCHEDQHSWSRFLLCAEYAQSSLRQDTTGLTPFQGSVWLSTRDLRLRLPCRKLSPRYIGPFQILRQINDMTFQLQLPPRYRIHPAFHVSLLKPFSPSATDTTGAEAEPPPPEVLDQPSIYTVHEILDSRHRGGCLEYLIDWEGYGPEKRSWVSREDVLDPTLLLDFHRSHPDRPAPRSHGRPQCRVSYKLILLI